MKSESFDAEYLRTAFNVGKGGEKGVYIKMLRRLGCTSLTAGGRIETVPNKDWPGSMGCTSLTAGERIETIKAAFCLAICGVPV